MHVSDELKLSKNYCVRMVTNKKVWPWREVEVRKKKTPKSCEFEGMQPNLQVLLQILAVKSTIWCCGRWSGLF